eukprot:scaffold119215_cov50-Phaeocystis_antarctica.AAC.4
MLTSHASRSLPSSKLPMKGVHPFHATGSPHRSLSCAMILSCSSPCICSRWYCTWSWRWTSMGVATTSSSATSKPACSCWYLSAYATPLVRPRWRLSRMTGTKRGHAWAVVSKPSSRAKPAASMPMVRQASAMLARHFGRPVERCRASFASKAPSAMTTSASFASSLAFPSSSCALSLPLRATSASPSARARRSSDETLCTSAAPRHSPF